ncbi:MAG: class III poly(R)-hydroxyalkanoic acid synthase subunit PhaE [Anaerolineales bacterium]|nr:class III poly(R)-hydroxyalkanoic acid synthase subunit PhaE [Anaerolineales bacterium]
MSEAWVEAQKTLWETWVEAVSSKPKSATTTTKTEMTDVWSQITQQNLDAWQGGAAPIAKAATEQFFAVQETAIRFLEFSTRLWEAIGPKMQAGEDWTSTLEKNIEQFRNQWIQFPEIVTGTAEDVDRLWNDFLQQWQRFGQPWILALQRAPEFSARIITGDSTAYIGLADLYRQAYQGTFARLVASPGLGMTREFNEKFQSGFDAWVSWQLATLEYQGVVGELWEQAFKQFQEDLITLAEKDQKIETLRDFVLLWTRGAEQVFTEGFQTERYVLAQGQMLNAAMAYRVHERQIIEVFLNLYDLPTRSELDETHRRIYQLRKEVKALKKTISELKSGTDGGKS